MSITWACTDSGHLHGKTSGKLTLIPCHPVKNKFIYKDII
jgi:hypothetical protein